jgi:hypothetical protein
MKNEVLILVVIGAVAVLYLVNKSKTASAVSGSTTAATANTTPIQAAEAGAIANVGGGLASFIAGL